MHALEEWSIMFLPEIMSSNIEDACIRGIIIQTPLTFNSSYG